MLSRGSRLWGPLRGGGRRGASCWEEESTGQGRASRAMWLPAVGVGEEGLSGIRGCSPWCALGKTPGTHPEVQLYT